MSNEAIKLANKKRAKELLDNLANASADTLAQRLAEAYHRSLGNTIVGRAELLDMSQKDYWHPKMMWYGPCGIGTGRGLEGFVDLHQRPYRIAFPKRQVGGSNHYVSIGDGKYSATGGWPSVIADHSGRMVRPVVHRLQCENASNGLLSSRRSNDQGKLGTHRYHSYLAAAGCGYHGQSAAAVS